MQHHRHMRVTHVRLVLLALVAGWLCGTAIASPARAQTSIAITYFDEPLAAYGYWVEDPVYGRVWRPRGTGVDWRPYTYGRWVYTSEYGWIWVSEEPWGWVVYHYGRWVWSSRHGWVWVAGDAWGPAWVEWCYGDGYVGWAPMPPDPYWQGGTTYYGSYDCASPRYYSRAVFVSEAHFTSPRVSAHVVASSQNPVAARGAVNVTSYSRAGAAVVNRSIDVARLQAATGVAIKPVRVVRAKGPIAPASPSSTLRELKIYRPVVTAGRPLHLDAARSAPLKLDPDLPSGLSPPPVETGGLPSLDRPGPGLSPPSLGGIGGPPLGGGGLGGGALGGVRRLGR